MTIYPFFAPQGRTIAPIGVKFGRSFCYALPNLTPIDPYLGISGRKNPKIADFCYFFASQGQLPQSIFPKFKWFYLQL